MFRRSVRASLGVAATTVALTAGLVVPTTGTAQALSSRSFSWNTQRSGDCTMFQNARWTLYSNGTATFDGTVTSSGNNDAWLMRAHIKDARNADLGTLTSLHPQNRADRTEFIKNLPNHTQRYRWLIEGGRFDARRFGLIRHMTLFNHC